MDTTAAGAGAPAQARTPAGEEILAHYRSGIGYGEPDAPSIPVFVPLSRGAVAMLDSADRHLLADGRSCHAVRGDGGLYAARTITFGRGERRTVLLHNLVLPSPTGFQVDRPSHRTLDCRRLNRRHATSAQQSAHRRRALGKSGFRGVILRGQRFRAYLSVRGRQVWSGGYAAVAEAALEQDRVARLHFGDFAVPNFPGDGE